MKRFAAALLLSVLSLGVLAGCGTAKTAAPADNKAAATDTKKNVVLKIGATPVPHAEILEFAKPLLAKEGIDLQIVTFTDYVQPNTALNDKQLDANYFQHVPYLDQFNADHKMTLVSAGAVHLEPMGFYSTKVSAVKDLKDGATIIIPNDPSNGGRALNLLAQQGLIKLKDGVGVKGTVKDIIDNPHKFKITDAAAEQLPRSLQDVD
ncbi:MAG: MetQ/NlpA family ABC transporter substrate-binding protein, partial [Mycobacterium leprae]